jgi:hypothetical protein
MVKAAGGLVSASDFPDTGWMNLVLNAGWTPQSGYTPQIRYRGGEVICRGRATHAGASGNQTVCAIPDGIPVPPHQWDCGLMWSSSTQWYRQYVDSTGIRGQFMTSVTSFYFTNVRWVAD